MRPFLLLVLSLTVFSACTPLRVVRVLPERDSDVARYEYGSALLEATAGQAVATVSYYDATRDHLVFNLEVTNNGTEPFDFDPGAIVLLAGPATVPAVDPELHLLDLDITAVRAERDRRTWGWIGLGLATAGAIALAVDPGTVAGSTDLIDNTLLVTQVSTDLAANAILLAADPTLLRQERLAQPGDLPTPYDRSFWLDYALRLTTISPGQSAVGQLVFPRQDFTNQLRMAIPLPEGEVEFAFRQVVLQP